MKRHDLSVRRRTDKYNCHLSLIGNADQTPLTFDIPFDQTLNVKGAKTVSLATKAHEKSHFTVMLSCMADGTKLPPFIGKTTF
jgi:hypothetical protein